ncbi:MAG: ATPase [Firmicutes bacterium HGW-Firmicutes-14]|nr:MAG: ATPase [Firmicutes bacterium HGW-Firmicutes-14]
MDILDVLNELEELVEESTKVPLVGKILIDDELILDMIDHIRTALPEEMRLAKTVAMERERILEEARNEAKRIMNEAREELSRMAGEDELVKRAKQQATEMLDQAKDMSREIKIGAYQFADDLLQKSEQNLDLILTQVKNAREQLRTPPAGSAETEAAAAE